MENPEHQILGALLLEPRFALEVMELSADEFVDDKLGEAFEQLRSICQTHADDPGGVLTRFHKYGRDRDSNWPAFIAKCMNSAVPAMARWYANEIQTSARRREIGWLCHELQARVASDPVDELVSMARAKLDEIQGRFQEPDPPQLIGDVCREIVDSLDTVSPASTIYTGIHEVDSKIGGFRPGELVIVGARTGVGKTALATQIGLHNSREGRRVMYVSLEMLKRQFCERVICGLAGVDLRTYRRGALNLVEKAALREWRHGPEGADFVIWAPSPARRRKEQSLEHVMGVARREHRRKKFDMICVDYLGLLQGDRTSKKSLNERIGEIVSELKWFCFELNIPIFLGCQLNRTAADGHTPTLATLRDSGSIEQDADFVLLLDRPDLTKPAAELIVAKARYGGIGKVRIQFDGKRGTFFDPISNSETF